MKKKKLELKREIIAKLNGEDMDQIKGGALWTLFGQSCHTNCITQRDPSECTICGTSIEPPEPVSSFPAICHTLIMTDC